MSDNVNKPMDIRGGSSKLIERGSDRVKGASGVFRMRERGARVSRARWGPGAKPR